VRRVAVLLLGDDARGLAPHHVGRRQVGLPQSEVDAARQRAVEQLPDRALLNPAQPRRRLELSPLASLFTLGRQIIPPRLT
jgi:hypothetical protein